MIDPTRITNFERTDNELQAFALFALLVAGKNSDVTARKLAELASKVDASNGVLSALGNMDETDLHNFLVANKVGQYGRIVPAIRRLSRLNLRQCTLDELMSIPGIGPKTARFFLLHSRRHVNVAVLDVHVLRWMRRFYEDAPTNTPQGLDYVKWENLYCSLRTSYYPCMSAADADLMIWMKESGRSEST
jgi:endonuclease III